MSGEGARSGSADSRNILILRNIYGIKMIDYLPCRARPATQGLLRDLAQEINMAKFHRALFVTILAIVGGVLLVSSIAAWRLNFVSVDDRFGESLFLGVTVTTTMLLPILVSIFILIGPRQHD